MENVKTPAAEIAELIANFASDSWYVRKQSSEKIAAFGKEALKPLMDAADSENDDVRFWALQSLARIPVEEAQNFLLERVNHPDKVIRAYAVLALGDSNDPRAVPVLILALNDESWTVCSNATKSLVRKGEAIVEELVEALKTANYNVAFWITKILSRIGPKGIQVLVTFLRFKNKNVRILVTEALSESKDISVVPYLVDCLRDETWSVQENAADALANMGEDVVEPLISLFKDERDIHDWIIKIFDKLGNKKLKPLINLLRHPDRDVRMRAAELLGSTRHLSAIKPLIDTLSDKVWLVRKAAAKALAQIGEIAIEPLIRNLKSDDENVRYWITTILGKIGDKSIDPLVKILQTGTREMKALAAAALGETRDGRAVRPLIEALKDESWVVRNAAATSLKQIGSETIFPLIKVLMAQNEDLRYWSQKIIADIGPQEVYQFIDILQNNEDNEMRYFAAFGLSIIKSPKAIEPLTYALLNDSDDWVRKYAATALGAIGDRRVVKPLIAALDSDNEELCYWITKVLGKLGPVAVEPLMEGMKSQDEKIRFYCMLALGETGDTKSLEALVKFLGETGSMADHAVRALSSASEAALPYLIDALASENYTLKNNAYQVMIRMGERIAGRLNELLEKIDNKEIKYWIAKVLRDIKKPKVRLKK